MRIIVWLEKVWKFCRKCEMVIGVKIISSVNKSETFFKNTKWKFEPLKPGDRKSFRFLLLAKHLKSILSASPFLPQRHFRRHKRPKFLLSKTSHSSKKILANFRKNLKQVHIFYKKNRDFRTFIQILLIQNGRQHDPGLFKLTERGKIISATNFRKKY